VLNFSRLEDNRLKLVTQSNLIFSFTVCLLALLAFGVRPVSAAEKGYEQALPGYQFKFPEDHYSHDQYKTEWWYFAGHLTTNEKKHYGYEVTFFRLGGDYEPNNESSAWKGDNYYLAHFAITDEDGKTFRFYEKLNRSKSNLAGAKGDACYVHNEGWSVTKLGEHFVLKADSPEYSIHLLLDPLKPPAVNGVDGVSQKAAAPGCASHCYSMTRLKTEGLLFVGGNSIEVTGVSWMDHEFGSNQLTAEQCGWDWYSLQLDDNRELMLYVIRRTDGTIEPSSSGTIVDARGRAKHIKLEQFKIGTSDTWHSVKSGGTYPYGWHISVPDEKLDVTLTAGVQDQELNTAAPTGITYWEGSVSIDGTSNGKKITGQGYVEMTGYSEKFKKSI
jgi:predicted secreted hydrolase